MQRTTLFTALSISLISAASALLVAPSVAHAQDAEAIAEARGNFQRAIELEHAGSWGEALKLFRRVGSVKMTPQVRYHIATCEENLDHLVVALSGYELALQQGEGMHPDFLAEVQGSIDDLKARIPKLVVERGEGAEAATIELDGISVSHSSIGSEMPLDPGPHTLTAVAPGFEDYRQTVTVAEGSVEAMTVEMVELKGTQTQVVVGSSQGETTEGYGVLPYVIGGAGIGAAAIGGVVLALSQGFASDATSICNDDPECAGVPNDDFQEAQRLHSKAQSWEIAGWATVGVGIGALAGGTVLYFLDRGRTEEARKSGSAFTLTATAPGSDAGFSLVGSF